MRSALVLVTALALTSCGCLHLALERAVVRQAGTITDVRYQQVVDNLAMLAHNPAMMPYYSVVTGGLAQIDDTVSANGSLLWGWTSGEGPGGMNSEMFGFSGQRVRTGNWSLDPLHDPDRIAVMRCVYQHVLGLSMAECADDCARRIRHFRLEEELGKMPAGWFGVGGKKDVPRRARYVGHYCATYVWVPPEGIEGLTRLSLIMLDIATVDLGSLSPTKHVETRYDKNCKRVEVVVSTDIDVNEPDCEPDKEGAVQGRLPKMRREMLQGLRSLLGPTRR